MNMCAITCQKEQANLQSTKHERKAKGKLRKSVINTTILTEKRQKIAMPYRFLDNARSSF
jgi:hypothetical protein